MVIDSDVPNKSQMFHQSIHPNLLPLLTSSPSLTKSHCVLLCPQGRRFWQLSFDQNKTVMNLNCISSEWYKTIWFRIDKQHLHSRWSRWINAVRVCVCVFLSVESWHFSSPGSMMSKKSEVKITAAFRPDVGELSNTAGKRQEIHRQYVGMCEEKGYTQTWKKLCRQITCGEDKFEIRKTLHDEKKDVGEMDMVRKWQRWRKRLWTRKK